MTAAEFERLARQSRQALLGFARRRARNHQDAEDAVQEALTIAFQIRERIRTESAVAYIAVTAGHEASRLRRHADRHRSLDQPLLGAQGWSIHDITPNPRHASRDTVINVLTCLRLIKPDEARALMARALGWSDRDICDAFAWTYTKDHVRNGRCPRAPIASRVHRRSGASVPVRPGR
jgi:DNA-directed RNA polymerase specialized sigma24 family protein